MTCFSTDDCLARFRQEDLAEVLGKPLDDKLGRLQLDDMFRKSGLTNLVACPFCQFSADCPPIEDDMEFRCQNPDCKMVTCRRCRKATHVPLTCEESESHRNRYGSERPVPNPMPSTLIGKPISECPKCMSTSSSNAH